LVPTALQAIRKGGAVVCAGIHMSPVPSFPYEILWGERSIRSVANLTRQDGQDFFSVAATVPLRIAAEPLALAEATQGLARLRAGLVRGALVLVPPSEA
jgi:propanol-preferring alcohol dehydrogenase